MPYPSIHAPVENDIRMQHTISTAFCWMQFMTVWKHPINPAIKASWDVLEEQL